MNYVGYSARRFAPRCSIPAGIATYTIYSIHVQAALRFVECEYTMRKLAGFPIPRRYSSLYKMLKGYRKQAFP